MMNKGKTSELRLKVPWGFVAAKAWGSTSGHSRVLMVHGILDNAGSFDRLVALLPDNFYYVAIDLPGHGLSSHMPPGTTLSYFNYLLTIKYVLDELQWEQAIYIGHSMGAHLGFYFTLVYPDKIKKLVLLDGLAPRYLKNEELIQRIREEQDTAVEASKIGSPRTYTKEEVMYALTNLRQCTLNTEAAEALFERAVTKVGDNFYSYNRDYRARISLFPLQSIDQCVHFIKQAKVETLLISVDSTLSLIQHVRDVQYKAVKGFSFINIVEVKGNHDVHNNNPERVSEYISNFLRNIPSKL